LATAADMPAPRRQRSRHDRPPPGGRGERRRIPEDAVGARCPQPGSRAGAVPGGGPGSSYSADPELPASLGLGYPSVVPSRWPTLRASPAAASPSRVCRPPERHAGRPVNSVIAAPIANSATLLTIRLATIAVVPPVTTNGSTGKIAPNANNRN